MADQTPQPRKPRSSAPLAAGMALLLGIPLAGFALKMWGPLLFAPDETPRAVVEITGPRRGAPPAAPQESRASSLDLVRGDPGAPQAAGPAPGPAAAPPPSQAPAQAQERPAPPAQPPALVQEERRYPKLQPNHGWKSWFVKQGLPSGVPDPVAPTQDQPQPRPAPADTPAQAAAAPAPSSPAPPAAAPAPKKPTKQGYKPPAPVYSAADQANQVAAGVGLGTADVAAAPQPNPEKARADGSCPRRGWWKSGVTGLCYYTQPACLANGAQPPCVQPNP